MGYRASSQPAMLVESFPNLQSPGFSPQHCPKLGVVALVVILAPKRSEVQGHSFPHVNLKLAWTLRHCLRTKQKSVLLPLILQVTKIGFHVSDYGRNLTHENHVGCKILCPQIKFYWSATVYTSFCIIVAEQEQLRQRPYAHKACCVLLRESCLPLTKRPVPAHQPNSTQSKFMDRLISDITTSDTWHDS